MKMQNTKDSKEFRQQERQHGRSSKNERNFREHASGSVIDNEGNEASDDEPLIWHDYNPII